jgi:hypothetical protein
MKARARIVYSGTYYCAILSTFIVVQKWMLTKNFDVSVTLPYAELFTGFE